MISNFFQLALSNPHTTAAGIVYAIGKWVIPILEIWWPSHKAQLEQTGEILKGIAVPYGLWAAGDAARSASKKDVDSARQDAAHAIESHDTTILRKNDVAQK